MADVLPFAAITDADLSRVGGKGLSLARCAAAGLPVPPGFVVPVNGDVDSEAVASAYHELGGPVAVRSSAVAEDGAEASFAGQHDTFLNIDGIDAVRDAIRRCRASADSERAKTYRQSQGMSASAVAVVVQRMVPADAAGVLFTQDPTDPASDAMLIEAARGLGEAVVSGRVQPDRFRVSRDGTILERPPVPTCGLSDTALSQLADLGRRVEAVYGDRRDIEWAVVGDTVYLLQARPITTGNESETVRREVIADARAKADPAGTVWVRYNLSEVLPEPTPLTWSVIRRLLAASGGFGRMNRDLGAVPDPALGDDGAFDLIAGRPMANLSRLPRLQFARPPVEYPFAAFKANPAAALNPTPVLNPWRVGLLRLPGVMRQVGRMKAATDRLSATFADEFAKLAPPFAAAARAASNEDWSGFDALRLFAIFDAWTERTLVEFARHSLKPTVLADAAWQSLVTILTPTLGPQRAAIAVAELAVGVVIPDEADLPNALRLLAEGTFPRDSFLTLFGHRGPNEMELAAPRWAERPELLNGQRPTPNSNRVSATDPASIAAEAKLTGPARDSFLKAVGQLRTYLGLREAGKHYLLMGYAVIRRAAVALDRHFNLNGGIFFLTRDEIPKLIAGDDLSAVIAARRKRRRLELGLPLPPVLFSDDLDAIGRALPPPDGATSFTGVALSPGVVEGPALVLTEPVDTADDGFILVCPTTDPAWVPLFARARGLVMETGGVLSHGAIVAREFGLPAVAGLPGILRRLRTGQRVRVDGSAGRIDLLDE